MSVHGSRPRRLDLQGAIDLAKRAHGAATDKAGRPYITHVMRVVAAVHGETDKMAAALHDVVEDTPVTLDDLAEAGSPPEVLEAVDALTRRPGEAYGSFLARIVQNEVARRVKIADLTDNADEQRLRLLVPREATRLRRKYATAIAALGASDEVAERWENERLEREATDVVINADAPIDGLARQATVDIEVSCERCRRVAGRLMRLGRIILRAEFMGRAMFPIDCDSRNRTGTVDLATLDSALAARDWAALYDNKPEYVPWWCRDCRRSYCDRDWVMDTRFDDGFYDCTYGTCPGGHTRKLDD